MLTVPRRRDTTRCRSGLADATHGIIMLTVPRRRDTTRCRTGLADATHGIIMKLPCRVDVTRLGAVPAVSAV